jgi:hypothetical protein
MGAVANRPVGHTGQIERHSLAPAERLATTQNTLATQLLNLTLSSD